MCAYKVNACSGYKVWDRAKYAVADAFNVWLSGCETILKKQRSLWNNGSIVDSAAWYELAVLII